MTVLTFTVAGAEAMPLVTTNRLLAPPSTAAGTVKLVEPMAPGATDRVLWLNVRA